MTRALDPLAQAITLALITSIALLIGMKYAPDKCQAPAKIYYERLK